MAFTYVLITVIVALTVPLAITLERRARVELERENLVRAESIAQQVGAENLGPGRRGALGAIVRQAESQVGGRVIVVDASGRLVADSQGTATGQAYATSGRPEILSALRNLPTSETRYSQDLGRDIMATAVPIVDESGAAKASVIGAVRITQSMAQVNENVRRTIGGVIAIGLAGLAAGLILAFVLAGSLSRPLRRLADVATRLGAGDLSARAGPTRGPAEIGELAASFDDMAGRLERTVRAQREFVANASHQLRTPLTGMKLRLEAARSDATSEEQRAQLSAAEQEADRLSATVDRLLATTKRIEAGRPVGTDLSSAAERAVERWKARADEAGSSFVIDGRPAPAQVDETEIDAIMDNLIDNAIAYARGRIEISTGSRGNHAYVAIRDHGPGIFDEDLPHVTERFYRGRGVPAGGSGLGLAVVRQLAADGRGTISIARSAGGGTIVEVTFPLSPPLSRPLASVPVR